MCIACEMSFMDMLESLPMDERERILREQFGGYSAGPQPAPPAPFVCEPFDEAPSSPQSEQEPERKP